MATFPRQEGNPDSPKRKGVKEYLKPFIPVKALEQISPIILFIGAGIVIFLININIMGSNEIMFGATDLCFLIGLALLWELFYIDESNIGVGFAVSMISMAIYIVITVAEVESIWISFFRMVSFTSFSVMLLITAIIKGLLLLKNKK